MTDKPKFYLAGPMTGLPDYNYPAFAQTKAELVEMGFDVSSPHEIDHEEGKYPRGTRPYTHYIKEGLKLLLTCDAIILLPGWQTSTGCRMEVTVAQWSGMTTHLYIPGASFPIANVEIEMQEDHAIIKVLDGWEDQ